MAQSSFDLTSWTKLLSVRTTQVRTVDGVKAKLLGHPDVASSDESIAALALAQPIDAIKVTLPKPSATDSGHQVQLRGVATREVFVMAVLRELPVEQGGSVSRDTVIDTALASTNGTSH